MKSLTELAGAINLRGPILPERTYRSTPTVYAQKTESRLYSECDCSECGGGDCSDCNCTSSECDND